MKKIIGKEGTGAGEFNAIRLATELGTLISHVETDKDGTLTVVFSDAKNETQIDAICAAHVPEPLPVPLTDIEQTQLAVAEAIEKQDTDKIEQQLAQAEMFEIILQMLEPQGGGE